MEPVSVELNSAVQTISNRLFPMGFDVVDHDAPDTLEKLNAQLKSGRMAVWSGASEGTIYGSPEVNYAFRAWHDWAHWRYQLPFTPQGEAAAAFVQVAHLARTYGDDCGDLAALVLAEVIGQAIAYKDSGEFPADQRAFTVKAAEAFRPLADELVAMFADTKSDRPAIRQARRWARNIH